MSAPAADSRTLAPVGRRLAEVTRHRRVGAYDVISCDDPGGPAPDPGQFYMLAAAERWGGDADERPFLPRAFSVLRRHHDGTLEFLLEDVGPGTRRLSELRPGDGMWVLGPLGRGFAPPRDGRRPILAGGGVGIAPLAIWSDHLTQSWRTGTGRPSALVLLGFRDAPYAEGAALIAGARVATDDGSTGHRGLVTDLLRAELGVPAQLALESGMACGFGACFGCVVPTRKGYVRLCVDGPVLDAAELDTALVPGAGH